MVEERAEGSGGWRFVSEEEAPIALELKREHEDFVVHELLSFTPSGSGEHLFLLLEKRGWTTPDVARHLARQFELEPRDVGWAGRKDARGVTRQWFSLRGVEQTTAEACEAQGLRLIEATRNDRKLRLGALRANRFDLLLRGVAGEAFDRAERVLGRLAEQGLPNFFGPQRFGLTGRGHELGRLLLQGRAREYLLQRLSPAHTPELPAVNELREVIQEGRRAGQRHLTELAPRLPGEFAGLANQLARRPGDWSSSLRALDRATLGLHLAAWQARVFNRVLGQRFESWTTPEPGDLLQFSGSGSLFEVQAGEDLAELKRRVATFELSLSGPLPGGRAPLARLEPGRIERQVICSEGGDPDSLEAGVRGLRLPGTRRPLRVPVGELTWGLEEAGLRLRFELPAGSYATTLVAELSKNPELR